MIRFTLVIYARRKNAIGVWGFHQTERDAETFDEARLALYDEFDHIHECRIVKERRLT